MTCFQKGVDRVREWFPKQLRRFASRVPHSLGLWTPAALPRVSGFPARGVLWRLRHPVPRSTSGDPIFPCHQTFRARRRCLVRFLQWGRSSSLTMRKVRPTTTLPAYHSDPAKRRGGQGMYACIAGNWDLGSVALTISRGSCGARSYTPSGLLRFSDMLLFPSAFASR